MSATLPPLGPAGIGSLLTQSPPGRGLPPPPLAFRARPVTQVLVNCRRWAVGVVLAAVHQRLSHRRQPVEHDDGSPDLLQAEHVPEAAPQLQAEGRGRLSSPGPSLMA